MCREMSVQSRMVTREKPLVQLSKRIFEGDVRVLGGHDASLLLTNLGKMK